MVRRERGRLKLATNLTLAIKVRRRGKKTEAVLIDFEILMCMFEIKIPPRGHLSEAYKL